MALKDSLTAFNRVAKFNDNKTEQVWEVFVDEFGRASVLEEGVTAWKVAQGVMRIKDIYQNMLTTCAAEVISDIATSTSSTIQVSSSWISSGRESCGQLTDTGVCYVPNPHEIS